MSADRGSGDIEPPRIGSQTPDQRVSAGQSAVDDLRLTRLATLIAASPHNLVSARDRGAVLERHIAECAAVADLLPTDGAWLDLGTGGGLPGLVLAVARPAMTWTLVDATRKKAAAVAEFIAALELHNARVVAGRAETLGRAPEHRGAYGGVVARAVAPLNVLAELARGFLMDGGLLLAMKGPQWQDEVEAAANALRVLRLDVVQSQRLPLPDRESWVVTMRAQGPPPPAYPRRDGVPTQQPL